ncbi:DNA-binding domain-containing protein, AraC-type [Opitutaceae bacterium TAV1]|nr:DNA-binding domain-containing protein, AraC-type [Opitutaceae bacterium TAV1]
MKLRFEKIPYAEGMSFACLSYTGRECSNPLHLHPEYELTHFVRGRGHWIVGDATGELQDGHLVLLGPELPHLFRMDASSRRRALARVLQFREDCLGPAFFTLPEARHIRELLTRARRGLVFGKATRSRIQDHLAHLLETPAERRLLPLLGLLETAAGDGNARFLASSGYRSSLQPGEAARINKVLDHVTARLDQEIYLADVARVAGLSEAAFSRFFRRTVKKTFSHFLNELRISQACRQLLETDHTITGIAFACGFNNLSNFNRRFLDLRGETPSGFRQRRQRIMTDGKGEEAAARFAPA